MLSANFKQNRSSDHDVVTSSDLLCLLRLGTIELLPWQSQLKEAIAAAALGTSRDLLRHHHHHHHPKLSPRGRSGIPENKSRRLYSRRRRGNGSVEIGDGDGGGEGVDIKALSISGDAQKKEHQPQEKEDEEASDTHKKKKEGEENINQARTPSNGSDHPPNHPIHQHHHNSQRRNSPSPEQHFAAMLGSMDRNTNSSSGSRSGDGDGSDFHGSRREEDDGTAFASSASSSSSGATVVIHSGSTPPRPPRRPQQEQQQRPLTHTLRQEKEEAAMSDRGVAREGTGPQSSAMAEGTTGGHGAAVPFLRHPADAYHAHPSTPTTTATTTTSAAAVAGGEEGPASALASPSQPLPAAAPSLSPPQTPLPPPPFNHKNDDNNINNNNSNNNSATRAPQPLRLSSPKCRRATTRSRPSRPAPNVPMAMVLGCRVAIALAAPHRPTEGLVTVDVGVGVAAAAATATTPPDLNTTSIGDATPPVTITVTSLPQHNASGLASNSTTPPVGGNNNNNTPSSVPAAAIQPTIVSRELFFLLSCFDNDAATETSATEGNMAERDDDDDDDAVNGSEAVEDSDRYRGDFPSDDDDQAGDDNDDADGGFVVVQSQSSRGGRFGCDASLQDDVEEEGGGEDGREGSTPPQRAAQQQQHQQQQQQDEEKEQRLMKHLAPLWTLLKNDDTFLVELFFAGNEDDGSTATDRHDDDHEEEEDEKMDGVKPLELQDPQEEAFLIHLPHNPLDMMPPIPRTSHQRQASSYYYKEEENKNKTAQQRQQQLVEQDLHGAAGGVTASPSSAVDADASTTTAAAAASAATITSSAMTAAHAQQSAQQRRAALASTVIALDCVLYTVPFHAPTPTSTRGRRSNDTDDDNDGPSFDRPFYENPNSNSNSNSAPSQNQSDISNTKTRKECSDENENAADVAAAAEAELTSLQAFLKERSQNFGNRHCRASHTGAIARVVRRSSSGSGSGSQGSENDDENDGDTSTHSTSLFACPLGATTTPVAMAAATNTTPTTTSRCAVRSLSSLLATHAAQMSFRVAEQALSLPSLLPPAAAATAATPDGDHSATVKLDAVFVDGLPRLPFLWEDEEEGGAVKGNDDGGNQQTYATPHATRQHDQQRPFVSADLLADLVGSGEEKTKKNINNNSDRKKNPAAAQNNFEIADPQTWKNGTGSRTITAATLTVSLTALTSLVTQTITVVRTEPTDSNTQTTDTNLDRESKWHRALLPLLGSALQRGLLAVNGTVSPTAARPTAAEAAAVLDLFARTAIMTGGGGGKDSSNATSTRHRRQYEGGSTANTTSTSNNNSNMLLYKTVRWYAFVAAVVLRVMAVLDPPQHHPLPLPPVPLRCDGGRSRAVDRHGQWWWSRLWRAVALPLLRLFAFLVGMPMLACVRAVVSWTVLVVKHSLQSVLLLHLATVALVTLTATQWILAGARPPPQRSLLPPPQSFSTQQTAAVATPSSSIREWAASGSASIPLIQHLLARTSTTGVEEEAQGTGTLIAPLFHLSVLVLYWTIALLSAVVEDVVEVGLWGGQVAAEYVSAAIASVASGLSRRLSAHITYIRQRHDEDEGEVEYDNLAHPREALDNDNNIFEHQQQQRRRRGQQEEMLRLGDLFLGDTTTASEIQTTAAYASSTSSSSSSWILSVLEAVNDVLIALASPDTFATIKDIRAAAANAAAATEAAGATTTRTRHLFDSQLEPQIDEKTNRNDSKVKSPLVNIDNRRVAANENTDRRSIGSGGGNVFSQLRALASSTPAYSSSSSSSPVVAGLDVNEVVLLLCLFLLIRALYLIPLRRLWAWEVPRALFGGSRLGGRSRHKNRRGTTASFSRHGDTSTNSRGGHVSAADRALLRCGPSGACMAHFYTRRCLQQQMRAALFADGSGGADSQNSDPSHHHHPLPFNPKMDYLSGITAQVHRRNVRYQYTIRTRTTATTTDSREVEAQSEGKGTAVDLVLTTSTLLDHHQRRKQLLWEDDRQQQWLRRRRREPQHQHDHGSTNAKATARIADKQHQPSGEDSVERGTCLTPPLQHVMEDDEEKEGRGRAGDIHDRRDQNTDNANHAKSRKDTFHQGLWSLQDCAGGAGAAAAAETITDDWAPIVVLPTVHLIYTQYQRNDNTKDKSQPGREEKEPRNVCLEHATAGDLAFFLADGSTGSSTSSKNNNFSIRVGSGSNETVSIVVALRLVRASAERLLGLLTHVACWSSPRDQAEEERRKVSKNASSSSSSSSSSSTCAAAGSPALMLVLRELVLFRLLLRQVLLPALLPPPLFFGKVLRWLLFFAVGLPILIAKAIHLAAVVCVFGLPWIQHWLLSLEASDKSSSDATRGVVRGDNAFFDRSTIDQRASAAILKMSASSTASVSTSFSSTSSLSSLSGHTVFAEAASWWPSALMSALWGPVSASSSSAASSPSVVTSPFTVILTHTLQCVHWFLQQGLQPLLVLVLQSTDDSTGGFDKADHDDKSHWHPSNSANAGSNSKIGDETSSPLFVMVALAIRLVPLTTAIAIPAAVLFLTFRLRQRRPNHTNRQMNALTHSLRSLRSSSLSSRVVDTTFALLLFIGSAAVFVACVALPWVCGARSTLFLTNLWQQWHFFTTTLLPFSRYVSVHEAPDEASPLPSPTNAAEGEEGNQQRQATTSAGGWRQFLRHGARFTVLTVLEGVLQCGAFLIEIILAQGLATSIRVLPTVREQNLQEDKASNNNNNNNNSNLIAAGLRRLRTSLVSRICHCRRAREGLHRAYIAALLQILFAKNLAWAGSSPSLSTSARAVSSPSPSALVALIPLRILEASRQQQRRFWAADVPAVYAFLRQQSSASTKQQPPQRSSPSQKEEDAVKTATAAVLRKIIHRNARRGLLSAYLRHEDAATMVFIGQGAAAPLASAASPFVVVPAGTSSFASSTAAATPAQNAQSSVQALRSPAIVQDLTRCINHMQGCLLQRGQQHGSRGERGGAARSTSLEKVGGCFFLAPPTSGGDDNSDDPYHRSHPSLLRRLLFHHYGNTSSRGDDSPWRIPPPPTIVLLEARTLHEWRLRQQAARRMLAFLATSTSTSGAAAPLYAATPAATAGSSSPRTLLGSGVGASSLTPYSMTRGPYYFYPGPQETSHHHHDHAHHEHNVPPHDDDHHMPFNNVYDDGLRDEGPNGDSGAWSSHSHSLVENGREGGAATPAEERAAASGTRRWRSPSPIVVDHSRHANSSSRAHIILDTPAASTPASWLRRRGTATSTQAATLAPPLHSSTPPSVAALPDAAVNVAPQSPSASSLPAPSVQVLQTHVGAGGGHRPLLSTITPPSLSPFPAVVFQNRKNKTSSRGTTPTAEAEAATTAAARDAGDGHHPPHVILEAGTSPGPLSSSSVFDQYYAYQHNNHRSTYNNNNNNNNQHHLHKQPSSPLLHSFTSSTTSRKARAARHVPEEAHHQLHQHQQQQLQYRQGGLGGRRATIANTANFMPPPGTPLMTTSSPNPAYPLGGGGGGGSSGGFGFGSGSAGGHPLSPPQDAPLTPPYPPVVGGGGFGGTSGAGGKVSAPQTPVGTGPAYPLLMSTSSSRQSFPVPPWTPSTSNNNNNNPSTNSTHSKRTSPLAVVEAPQLQTNLQAQHVPLQGQQRGAGITPSRSNSVSLPLLSQSSPYFGFGSGVQTATTEESRELREGMAAAIAAAASYSFASSSATASRRGAHHQHHHSHHRHHPHDHQHNPAEYPVEHSPWTHVRPPHHQQPPWTTAAMSAQLRHSPLSTRRATATTMASPNAANSGERDAGDRLLHEQLLLEGGGAGAENNNSSTRHNNNNNNIFVGNRNSSSSSSTRRRSHYAHEHSSVSRLAGAGPGDHDARNDYDHHHQPAPPPPPASASASAPASAAATAFRMISEPRCDHDNDDDDENDAAIARRSDRLVAGGAEFSPLRMSSKLVKSSRQN